MPNPEMFLILGESGGSTRSGPVTDGDTPPGARREIRSRGLTGPIGCSIASGYGADR